MVDVAADAIRSNGEPRCVSVIIPVGDPARLGRQLDALARQRYAGVWEVVIADNHGRGDVNDLAHAWRDRLPDLRVVDASRARGACHARNVGSRAARGDLLVYCDADDEVAPGWLAALVDAANHADLVSGRLDYAALNPGVTFSEDRLPIGLGFRPYAPSGNCAIWSSVLEEIGGWNERYRRLTDMEFSWRVAHHSFRLGYTPDAVVRYRLPATRRSLFRQSFGWGKSEAQLFRDFGELGIRRPRLRGRPQLAPDPRPIAASHRASCQAGRLVTPRRPPRRPTVGERALPSPVSLTGSCPS
jgi:glycosyltransferase involved in cell wall biosynthesis